MTMKCFQVDGEGCDAEDIMIIFAKTAIEAKRRWSNEHWDGETIAGVSAKRKPEWDCHAPRPVPALELIDAGWWFECHGCGTQISNEYIGTTDRSGFDEDEWELDREYGPDLTIPLMAPVELPHQRVYCTQACCDADLLEKSRIKRMMARATKVMQAAILRRFPTGVEFHGEGSGYWAPHVHVARSHGYLLIHQIVVTFIGPGMKYGASLRCDDEKWRYARIKTDRWSRRHGGYRSLRLPLSARTRDTGYTVAGGDKEIFEAWADATKKVPAEMVL
jgi:hypothetical protein